MSTGTFKTPSGEELPAKLLDDTNPTIATIEITYPEGHADKPEGGPLLVHGPLYAFTADPEPKAKAKAKK